MALGGLIVKKN